MSKKMKVLTGVTLVTGLTLMGQLVNADEVTEAVTQPTVTASVEKIDTTKAQEPSSTEESTLSQKIEAKVTEIAKQEAVVSELASSLETEKTSLEELKAEQATDMTYQSTLEEYRTIYDGGKATSEASGEMLQYSNLVYALEDLDGDGEDELIFAGVSEHYGIKILDIYRLGDNDNVERLTTGHLGQLGYRMNLYPLVDGSYYYMASGGAAYSSHEIYSLTSKGFQIEKYYDFNSEIDEVRPYLDKTSGKRYTHEEFKDLLPEEVDLEEWDWSDISEDLVSDDSEITKLETKIVSLEGRYQKESALLNQLKTELEQLRKEDSSKPSTNKPIDKEEVDTAAESKPSDKEEVNTKPEIKLTEKDNGNTKPESKPLGKEDSQKTSEVLNQKEKVNEVTQKTTHQVVTRRNTHASYPAEKVLPNTSSKETATYSLLGLMLLASVGVVNTKRQKKEEM